MEQYILTKYAGENGRIQVSAVKDKARFELYLDPANGQLTSVTSRPRGGYGAQAGLETAAILSSQKTQGYDVVGFERERDEMEGYARKDGQSSELKVDTATGLVLRSDRIN